MQVKPWEPLPNPGAYYRLFLRVFLREFLRFGWPQVGGAVIAAATLALQLGLHLIPPNVESRTFIAVVGPYLALIVILAAFALFVTPLRIDGDRNSRIDTLEGSRDSLKRQIDTERQANQVQIKDLQNQLANKGARSEADEYHYDRAKAQIANLSEPARVLLRHVWSHQQVQAGLGLRVPELDTRDLRYLFQLLENTQMVRQRQEVGPGVSKIWWEIVPAYRDILAALLYTESGPTALRT